MATSYFPTVRYWLDVEALTYPDLPKARGKQVIKTYKYTDKLPWEVEPGRHIKEDHKYFVFFGLVDRQVLERELREQYRPPEPDENYSGNQTRPDTGRTFLCAVEVTANGRVSKTTLQTAAFAVSFAEKKNSRRIQYDDVTKAVSSLVDNLLADAGEAPVNGAWFSKVIEFLIEELSWKPSELMAREQICVQRVSLVKKDGQPL
jgi:hypothetical protein